MVKSKRQRSEIASRQDVQFIEMFLAGLIALYLSGNLASLLSSYFLTQHIIVPAVTDYTIYSPINVALVVMTIIFYTGLSLLAMLGVKRSDPSIKTLNLTLGGLVVLILAGCMVTINVFYSAATSVQAGVWVDLGNVVATGLIYVLGWWSARHYVKLKAKG